MDPAIRPVSSIDELTTAVEVIYAQVADMISQNSPHYRDVPKYFPTYQELMLVAELDGEIVGAILGYGPEEGPVGQFSVLVKGLGVSEQQRGRGLGRLLLEELETRAAAMGAVEVHLGAVPSARAFYTRLGYSGKSRMHKALTGNGVARYGTGQERQLRLEELRARRIKRITSP
ncbi:MAG TPA: GNAT family N-acetyltransferase [Mycobacteriales bacterium]|nr:GNAT family N-acetyltransferase [Mycobacteriales bacterium]